MTGHQTDDGPLVSIVLPIYNQADHIERVIHEYDAALGGLRLRREFILVVNGAGDDSYQACLQVASAVRGIRVLQSAEAGWGLAVRLGLAEAQGEIICYANSARTTGRNLALVLLHATLDRHVVVKASRKIRDSAARRIGSLLFNLECRALFDLANWDVNGTPKAFPREFEPLLRLTRADDLIDLEFNVVCSRQSYPMIEVPIFSARRHGGKSTTNLATAWRIYWGALLLWWELRGQPRRRREEDAA
jgi:glycosyltransferase involved in cell wall biosynthesis